MDWWNGKYFIRRQLSFTSDTGSTIPAGYPLYVQFDYVTLINSFKVRSDFADLQVLYWDSTLATPAWQLLGRDVSIVGANIVIKFNTVKAITLPESNYYVYMGNSSLLTAPTTPTYTSADYVIDTSTASGLGLTFTRPTEDWENGLSQVVDAKATFAFSGISARIVMEMGPDHGIMQLKVDSNDPIFIDTFAATTSQVIVYTASDLIVGKHYFRMQATNEKNPASTNNQIKIIKVQYSKFTEGIDQGEEIYSTSTPIRIVVGP